MLTNLNNYGPYAELAQTGFAKIYTRDLTIDNLDFHFDCIVNIFKDGIEDPFVHGLKIEVNFTDNEIITLSIFDYFFNIIFWRLPLSAGSPITSEFLFFEENITRGSIKKYIDKKFISKYLTKLPNIKLNNFIDDTLCKFKVIDDFSMYFLNTINNEDTIDLMNQNPDFYNYIHADLSDVPLEDVKDVGMDYTRKAIECIKNSSHCLGDSFRAGEGINPKQFKEFLINIGSKPDGSGKAFNGIINSSFSNEGVNTPGSYFIDEAGARVAEMLKKDNVGDSGHFSRLLGLNNELTRIHPDPHYSCNTKTLQKITIINDRMLSMYRNRYFRYKMNGPEYCMGPNPETDKRELIGQTVYFRSPMTCASYTHGDGICYKCYGDLAYTNNDINIGKIAAEILCAILTQRLLSAKHLLESLIVALKWSDNFLDMFDLNFNIINIKEELEGMKKYKLVIDPNSIEPENEDDEFDYNDFVTSFSVLSPDGSMVPIHTEDYQNIYLSKELSDILAKEDDPIDGAYAIPFDKIKDINLFLVKLSNNELSKTLDELKKMINKISDIVTKTRDQWLQDLLEVVIEGNLGIDAIHCEVLLANQIRSADDILEYPFWEYENEDCQLLSLTQALTNHPNITVSLEFEKLPKALYSPISFRKSQPSILDLFLMERPQDNMDVMLIDDSNTNELIPLMVSHKIKKPN